MAIKKIVCLSSIISIALSLPHKRVASPCTDGFEFVTREEWGARPPGYTTELNTPAPLVIVHHSYDPKACYNVAECSEAMRYMQDMHQITNGWEDIGYNYAVGSDGVVYEGRGWTKVGSHAAGYNTVSIGIVLIGDWVSSTPPKIQIATAKKLIKVGIKLGYIKSDYMLAGHRQVRNTECPGEALFEEISTWDRFTTTITL